MLNSLIIFLAQYYLIIPILVAGLYFLSQSKDRKREIALFAAISFPLIYLVAVVGSRLYFDPRPFALSHTMPLIPHDSDNGFPSDHALLLAAVATLFSFFNRRLAVFLWISTFLVGFARVAAGIHHPIDIVGSIVISIVVSSLVYYALTKTHILPYGTGT